MNTGMTVRNKKTKEVRCDFSIQCIESRKSKLEYHTIRLASSNSSCAAMTCDEKKTAHNRKLIVYADSIDR